MSLFSTISIRIQRTLFPILEEEMGVLSDKEQQLVRILEVVDLRSLLKDQRWCGVGRIPHSREALAKAFIAKALWDFPTTRALIDMLSSSPKLRRLCGWESVSQIPHESAFSRAFDLFSIRELPANIHRQIVSDHLSDHLFGHVSRDSTAIEAREKPEAKEPVVKEKKPKGRPRKGEQRAVEKSRIQQQTGRSLKKNLKDLPKACDVGTKKNSKGYKESWTGYKLHLDTVDGDIPVSAILTSASLHDSQVAIPLAQMTASRITNLYDLMDAAYDAKEIHAYSRRLGHVPLIDHNPRGGEKHLMEPFEAQRYKERSSSERTNSDLKDNHGGRHLRVRGAKKVFCHLMFGIVVITVKQLFHLLE